MEANRRGIIPYIAVSPPFNLCEHSTFMRCRPAMESRSSHSIFASLSRIRTNGVETSDLRQSFLEAVAVGMAHEWNGPLPDFACGIRIAETQLTDSQIEECFRITR